jgi:hypothetical protein
LEPDDELIHEAEGLMADEEEYQRLLGKAALNVWGDMPRDVQEALFENAMRDRADLRSDLGKFLHDRHPRTERPKAPN